MLEGLRPCTILFFFFFNVHSTVEYLNRNVSIGQLLQQIDFARSRPKMLTKTYNKEVSQASKLFPFQPINYAKRKPEKKYPGMNGTGEPMTSGIPVQCSTNWAIKPYTREGQINEYEHMNFYIFFN